MLRCWFLGLPLGVAMMAAQPNPTQPQAWVLALDNRGGMVEDLKAEEFQVKVGGKTHPVTQVATPAQSAEIPCSWVLVFEPIRDMNLRATAFVAAADFLAKLPEGDRVFIVARGKDALESLMPGLSLRRSLWAEALAKLPGMLPEALVGSSKETLQGAGFQSTYSDATDGAVGQTALTTLLAQFQGGASGWAKGTLDRRGVDVLDRLNFNDPGFVRGLVTTITRETKAMESIFDHLAALQGQKNIVVFSRCESDDMCHPSVKRAMSKGFQRQTGDQGGPRESAELATGEMTLRQSALKNKAAITGITLFSMAGSGQNILGLVGPIASATGGFAFPLASGMEAHFGQNLQIFGSRYLVRWSEETTKPGSLELTTTRKDVKLFVRSIR